MTSIRRILIALLVGILIILGTSVYLYLTSIETQSARSLVGERFRELVSPSDFLHTNGSAITIGEHIGRRVVLIEFMRYGCPNCQRSFPMLVSLHERYREKGLTVIGIHTPQFPHEGARENVEKAMEGARITFPVVLDNSYGIWNAYENTYWPRTFLIDMEGTIVYDSVGVPDETLLEAKIIELTE